MERREVKGVTIWSLPKSWWEVRFVSQYDEFQVIEIEELPEQEDLGNFKSEQGEAVELARKLNSDYKRGQANQNFIRCE